MGEGREPVSEASIRRRAGNPYSLSPSVHIGPRALCRRHRRPRPRGSSSSGSSEAIGSSLSFSTFVHAAKIGASVLRLAVKDLFKIFIHSVTVLGSIPPFG
jgi:hypothetical protein